MPGVVRGKQIASQTAGSAAVGAASGAVAGVIVSPGLGAAAGAAGGQRRLFLPGLFGSNLDSGQRHDVEDCLRQKGYNQLTGDKRDTSS